MKTSVRILCSLALGLALFVPVIADTIRLKDGNVIRGQVIGFRDQQFTVLVGSGAQGRRSRTIVYVEDVESIEFDSATAGSASPNDDTPASNTARTSQRPRTNPQPDNTRKPVRTSWQSAPGTSPTFFSIKVAVRADNANNGWTNSGLVVRKGQRLRISATGRVSLGGGRFSTPSGLLGSPDNDKLMRNEATGA